MKQWTALFALVALTSACAAKEEAPAADTAAAMAAAPTATFESMAGDYTWTMKAEVGDSVLGTGSSRSEVDGTGYSINNARPTDTTRFKGKIEGGNLISESAPYTDPAMPKAVGQVTWRVVAPLPSGTGLSGIVTVSPVSKPDSVLVRARVETVKK